MQNIKYQRNNKKINLFFNFANTTKRGLHETNIVYTFAIAHHHAMFRTAHFGAMPRVGSSSISFDQTI